RRRRLSLLLLFLIITLFAVFGLFVFGLSSIDPATRRNNEAPDILAFSNPTVQEIGDGANSTGVQRCATVEKMGEVFSGGYLEETIRVRKIIQAHFSRNGASAVREFNSQRFCNHGFVLGKASEAGLGNELYKILTAAALSVMLNRSLIIGQTRHIGFFSQALGSYPFGDYIYYSNVTFTLKEVKHLWRKNGCFTKYGRHLTMRIDDFLNPSQTNVLCSNWREWEQPIIWLQNTTDAVAAQFFLKNLHSAMRESASDLFGRPEELGYRSNVFGELMRILISPSREVDSAVNWALNGGKDPDIALHMRMMMNRSPSAKRAAVECTRRTLGNLGLESKPRVVIVSDTPAVLGDLAADLDDIAEVVHFDYEGYGGNISGNWKNTSRVNFRIKDWGPAPRWVAFVDFFLAARAKHAIISGAHRRVGTTYAQLIAALAASYRLVGTDEKESKMMLFMSSFQRNLVWEGLNKQIGWGHVWNRYGGPLSCHNQPNQCAVSPLLPPGWWDGLWQSPIPRDVHRMEAYGVKLHSHSHSHSPPCAVDEQHLIHFCSWRKRRVISVNLI
ncbi:hypothetical protein M569_13058, partial [Genlisea aurea]